VRYVVLNGETEGSAMITPLNVPVGAASVSNTSPLGSKANPKETMPKSGEVAGVALGIPALVIVKK